MNQTQSSVSFKSSRTGHPKPGDFYRLGQTVYRIVQHEQEFLSVPVGNSMEVWAKGRTPKEASTGLTLIPPPAEILVYVHEDPNEN